MMVEELHEGDPAPDFTLPRSSGGSVSLRDLRGSGVVLYFYPKDDTPGCTKEACNFRDRHDEIEGARAVVLGVSPDSVAAHDKFAGKYKLPFALLADTNHEVAEAYGVWVQKSKFGRKYMGVERSTFLIDPEGKISKIWRKVKPDSHALEVLESLA
ncbi:MAG: thioredoxin-dependent thiol peroxidase [Chloroflexota bacterium]